MVTKLGFETSEELYAFRVTAGFSDDIPENLCEEVQAKAEELLEEADKAFEEYLKEKGLKNSMGLLIKKEW